MSWNCTVDLKTSFVAFIIIQNWRTETSACFSILSLSSVLPKFSNLWKSIQETLSPFCYSLFSLLFLFFRAFLRFVSLYSYLVCIHLMYMYIYFYILYIIFIPSFYLRVLLVVYALIALNYTFHVGVVKLEARHKRHTFALVNVFRRKHSICSLYILCIFVRNIQVINR